MRRRQTLTTLSPAERSVAEQHYRLVEWYVRHRGLPVDEYLDVAVFGYLLAVKRWFARPDLYRYEFTPSPVLPCGVQSATSSASNPGALRP